MIKEDLKALKKFCKKRKPSQVEVINDNENEITF